MAEHEPDARGAGGEDESRPEGTLAAALEREHREIDGQVEAFIAGLDVGDARAEVLAGAMQALRRHIYLEEEFLFPPLRDAGLIMPLLVMVREHGELWNTMDALQAGLDGGPAAGSLPEASHEFLAQLDRHNRKEEPIIYPQADTGLTAPARAALTAFLDTGQAPDGWTCSEAGSAAVSAAERPDRARR